MLAIEGTIITIDAMGCQRAIAQKIIDKNTDYVLALKSLPQRRLGATKARYTDTQPELFVAPCLGLGTGLAKVNPLRDPLKRCGNRRNLRPQVRSIRWPHLKKTEPIPQKN
jgi:hypothetical protein